MRKFIKYSALFTIVCLLSCENPANVFRTDGFETDFYLADSSGIRMTTFVYGEDVVFHYLVKNAANKSQLYFIPDAGPFVRFEVFDSHKLMGTSVDGLAFATVIVEDSLGGGDTLALNYGWLFNDSHDFLPVGDYTAWAVPRLRFTEMDTPLPERLEFKVIDDSVSLVKITDATPDSIQLDRFSLKSLQIVKDTLSLSITYGGGCEKHDFALFMSPAAFLESYPVQANLYLRHNSHGDVCKALIQKTVEFNLRPIAELYQQFYGNKDEIIINVFDYFESQPGMKLSAIYHQ